MRLVRLFSDLRARLRRPRSGGAGSRPVLPPSAGPGEKSEFDELLEAVGSALPRSRPESAAETRLALRDATIAELREMLARLSGIGDELARTEQERLRLAARVAELEERCETEAEEAERAAERSQESLERLERKLAQREGVLARERERHAATREKLAEQKRLATERWHELKRLRSEAKQLRAAVDAVDEVPPALPSTPARHSDARAQ